MQRGRALYWIGDISTSVSSPVHLSASLSSHFLFRCSLSLFFTFLFFFFFPSAVHVAADPADNFPNEQSELNWNPRAVAEHKQLTPSAQVLTIFLPNDFKNWTSSLFTNTLLRINKIRRRKLVEDPSSLSSRIIDRVAPLSQRQNVVVSLQLQLRTNNNRVRLRRCTRSIRQVCARTVIGTRLRCRPSAERANRKESRLPLSNAGLPTVTWHYRVLTVRHTSPSPNDDVYKVVSTTVGNDVRPPWPASIGVSQRVVRHPQRIIPSRYIEPHCPNQSRRLSLNGWRRADPRTLLFPFCPSSFRSTACKKCPRDGKRCCVLLKRSRRLELICRSASCVGFFADNYRVVGFSERQFFQWMT